jgi:hypothetical protein
VSKLHPVFMPPESQAPPAPVTAPRLEPYPVFIAPPPQQPVPVTENRSLRRVKGHLTETWQLLEAGTYVRLMRMTGTAEKWPPKVRGWLVPPSSPPPGITEPGLSSGMFVQYMQFWVDQCPAPLELHYGKAADPFTSVWPPGHILGYLVHELPAAFGGTEPALRARKDAACNWWVIP